MSNRYKAESFPRCVSCTPHWAGDTCRFQGIRFFLKDEKQNIVGVRLRRNFISTTGRYNKRILMPALFLAAVLSFIQPRLRETSPLVIVLALLSLFSLFRPASRVSLFSKFPPLFCSPQFFSFYLARTTPISRSTKQALSYSSRQL